MLSPADDTDAQAYFTKTEWSYMVTIEKNRVTNMLRNYKYLLAQGIDAKPPDFILRCENRRKQELKITQISRSEVSFENMPAGSSNWGANLGQDSYGTYWEEGLDGLSPVDENLIKGKISWGNGSTNCDENCPDFCQYCYIFKQLKYGDCENKPLSPVGYCMSNRNVLQPLKPSNSLPYNHCQCGCQFPIKTKLIPPQNEQQMNDIYCQECGQKFAKQKYLKTHLKRFSFAVDSRPFKCMFCSHSFVHDKTRRFHERVHNSSKLIPCCHCHLKFADLTSARVHIDETHQDRMHVCDECGMSYSNASHLLRHKREVRKQYSHQCYICGHRYLTAIALSRHELHHSRVKPFRCKICMKTFSSKIHLTKHLNSRNAEKKYECQNCKVKFLAQKSLKKHERIFNGDRPFKCVVCGHAYNSKARLTVHMKVHYTEQNYVFGGENYVNC